MKAHPRGRVYRGFAPLYCPKIFHSILGCVSTFLKVSVRTQKFQILTKSNLSVLFSFFTCTFGIIFKKPLPNQGHEDFSHVFSSKSFVVLALTVRPMIYFKLVFYVV